FNLKGHTSRLNFLTVYLDTLLSASDDKTIIQWSFRDQTALKVLKRYSATALGHLCPVNSLSLCEGTLFSAGSDTTVRRWNIITGRHEDMYFGFTKPVTSVCYNGSVFAGSEDFSVLMYSPSLPLNVETKSSIRTATTTRRGVRTKVASKLIIASSEMLGTSLLFGGIIVIVLLVAVAVIAFFYRSSKAIMKQNERILPHAQEVSYLTTDLETVINTVVGISKHAV
ncbi:hypothetical protein MP638_005180, partial [Amoeboaphelidium occidentale]